MQRDRSKARAGDVMMCFHNASGLAAPQKRQKYVRRMVQGMTIFAAVETGLHGVEEKETIREAKDELGIHATVITGGYVGAKSGIAIYVPKSDTIPEDTIRKGTQENPRGRYS